MDEDVPASANSHAVDESIQLNLGVDIPIVLDGRRAVKEASVKVPSRFSTVVAQRR